MARIGLWLVFGSLLFLHACRSDGGEGDAGADAAVTVRTATVRAVTQSRSVAMPGTVVSLPDHQAAIAATVPARVLSVLVHPGQAVAVGQLIATLAPDPNAADDLRKATVAADAAERERRRQQRLYDVGVAAKGVVDQAAAAAATAAADQHAKALALRLAQGNAQLRSPIRGTVVAVTAAVGATADLATPVATVADLSRVAVQAEATAEALVGLRAGLAVQVTAPPGPALSGRLVTLPPAVDPATQRGQAWVEVANPDRRLRLGQFVTVRAPLAPRRILAVPAIAVVMRQSGPVAYTVAGGKAVAHPVRTRQTDDPATVEVLAGLAAGDVVAVDADPLADGTAVRVEARP